MTRIIGIDPSMTGTGVADHDGRLETITFDRRTTGDVRLTAIGKTVRLRATGCDLAIVEDLPTHAHGAGITGMVQGVIRYVLMQAGVPYVTVPAATLKKYSTGRGNATKADMRMALYQRAEIDIRDDNQVDAWWLRQLGLDAVGHPDAIQLPRAQREAMLKLTWPKDIAAALLEPYERVVTT